MVDLNQLHPKVKALALKLISECKKQGIEIKITSGYRSAKEQNELYSQGRTRSGTIVTNLKGGDSMHNFGVAFDVCINIKGNDYNESLLGKVGKIGKSIGLEWGGDFKSFKDMPHFQYTEGLTLKDFKAGKTLKEAAELENGKFKFFLNGKEVKVESVIHKGNNYIKLRDIAEILGVEIEITKNGINIKKAD